MSDEPYHDQFETGLVSLEVALQTGDHLVLVGCGGSARIPIDLDRYPVPGNTEVTASGTSVHLEWDTSEAPDTSIVSLSYAFAATRCHGVVDGSFDRTFASTPPGYYEVETVIRRSYDTGLGQVRTWTGGSDAAYLER